MTDRPDHAIRDRAIDAWNRGVDAQDRTVPTDAPDEHAGPGLRATVVRHDDRPDRCTIYPAEATRDERMVTWLTADADAFVRTEEMR